MVSRVSSFLYARDPWMDSDDGGGSFHIYPRDRHHELLPSDDGLSGVYTSSKIAVKSLRCVSGFGGPLKRRTFRECRFPRSLMKQYTTTASESVPIIPLQSFRSFYSQSPLGSGKRSNHQVVRPFVHSNHASTHNSNPGTTYQSYRGISASIPGPMFLGQSK